MTPETLAICGEGYDLKATHRARACEAMRWRPLFLKALAMSGGYMFALRAAGVCYNTFRAHERNDPEFAGQVREAEAEGAQLLHDVCWKRVTEGDLEPVYWQGQIVGHIRKFDTRLQIEFLRSYMPERFKPPGAQVNVGVKSDVFVLTEEQRHILMDVNREWLLDQPADEAMSQNGTVQPKQLTNETSEPTTPNEGA